MKHKVLNHALGKLAVVALCVCAVIAGINLWISSAVRGDSNDGRRQYVARIRDGLSEVRFASSGDSDGKVNSSIDSLARFIQKRSGLSLTEASKDRLATMEGRVLGGNARRISASELNSILSRAFSERVATLSDQELSQVIETLRGFNSPELPETFQRSRSSIKIRASWGGPKVTENVASQVKTFRNQARDGDATFQLLLNWFVKKEVEARGQLFNEAAPALFPQSGTWKSPLGTQLTPAQALLVAYSVISDDNLLDSEANLRASMKDVEKFRAKRSGQYPSCNGHFAYGANGYLYASPLDLFFNEQTVNRLLQLVEERSAH